MPRQHTLSDSTAITKPIPMRNVSNSALLSYKPLITSIFQMLVQHPIQPPRFVLIPIDPILNLLGSVSREVIRLSLHRTHAGVHEEEPIGNFDVLSGPTGVGEFVVPVVSGNVIQLVVDRIPTESVWFGHLSIRYSIILPLSNTRIGFPSSQVSVRAGMRPLGLISRNQGSF